MAINKVIFVLIHLVLLCLNVKSQISTDCGDLPAKQIVDSCPEAKIVNIFNYSNFRLKNNYKIPIEIFELKELEELHIKNLPVKTIPKEIQNLVKLNWLHFSNCRISYLPHEISLIDSLLSLHVIDCRLKSIPRSIVKIKSLRSISVQGNKGLDYQVLFNDLKNTNVIQVNFGHKSLKNVDTSIISLQNLEYINICNSNNLDFLSTIQTTNQLKNLKKLQFNNCKIRSKDFKQLKKIRPNVKLQFVNCKTPKNAINELKLVLKNTNEVIIGYDFKPKRYGSF
ncbi:MAG: hypothetical protein Q8R57_15535 [Bacteroidota bacterium]|nr:hypothetical protein [Bacteroidota bacterium]